MLWLLLACSDGGDDSKDTDRVRLGGGDDDDDDTSDTDGVGDDDDDSSGDDDDDDDTTELYDLPVGIGQPQFWYDARLPAQSLGDQESVTTWADRGTFGYALQPAISAPVLDKDAANGEPAVVVTDDKLISTGNVPGLGDGAFTLFAVINVPAGQPTTSPGLIAGFGNLGTAGAGIGLMVDPLGDRVFVSNGGGRTSSTNNGSYDEFFDELAIVSIEKNPGPLSNLRLCFNGDQQSTSPSEDVAPALQENSFFVGEYSGDPANVTVGELMLFNYAVGDAARQEIECHLADIWDVFIFGCSR